MANIRIKRTHQLGTEKARVQVEAFARSLKEELQIDYEWDGNRLIFKRTGASGSLEVGVDSLELDIELGLSLSLLAGTIEKDINKKLDAALK
ncbi:polyhydroxyalkanoic acid system family protein [Candidatus Thiosymbion oneisti]|uniref:polyhydroxyalkanoic acid system family protein n=1 Tax=Candidatus Thiosymbion oneisti TaxID=589554 RepID=UPI000B80073C|nr:polyhydroxyalkanoic acid system family protein [Candidatus Thiosymbion oneisti]